MKHLCSILLIAFGINQTFALTSEEFKLTKSHVILSPSIYTMAAGEMKGLIAMSGRTDLIPYIKGGVDARKLEYTTPYNEENKKVSGLIVFPQGVDTMNPSIIVFNHGTIINDKQAPSYQEGYNRMMSLYAANGYILIAPDYIGYGSSNDVIHPYMNEKITASTIMDMIKATQQLLDSMGIKYKKELFITGHSEGAAATLAVQKVIETDKNNGLTLAATAPLAWPYSESFDAEGFFKRDTLLNSAYISMAVISFNEQFMKRPLNKIFQEPYASAMDTLFTSGLDDKLIYDYLPDLASELFTPEYIKMASSDMVEVATKIAGDRLLITHNWAPTTPMLFVHGDKDILTPYESMKAGLETFKKNGTAEGIIQLHTLEGMGHGEALFYGMVLGLDFFNEKSK